MGHNYRFGAPPGGWITFDEHGKRIREGEQEVRTPQADDGKRYQLITLEGEPLEYWDIKEPAYGYLIWDEDSLCINLTTEDDFWYPYITDLKEADVEDR